MTRRYNHVAMEFLYGIFHYLALTIYDICFRGEVAGLENIPKRGAFIVACNHASHLDPPIIGSLVPRQMAFFARKTLWKPGIASWWLDGVGTIPVDRDGGSDVTAIRRVLQTLNSGKALILFPEGTRSPDGNLQSAKPGVGLIACKTQAPVLPVRIFNSHEAFGRKGGLRLGTRVSVTFGPVLPPAVYDPPGAGRDRYQKTSERIMLAISQLSEARPPVI
ncbi:MAG TPA: lysophospholipid acyltransferase family protein [Opitutaceae bacterium]|nr:lysophospholipid acyltransferase family protein [Opitutaceae bacterium]